MDTVFTGDVSKVVLSARLPALHALHRWTGARLAVCALLVACTPGLDAALVEKDAIPSASTTPFDGGMTSDHAASAADAQAPQDAAEQIDVSVQARDAALVTPDAGDTPDPRDAGVSDAMRDAAPTAPCLAPGSGDYGRSGPYGVKREIVTLAPDAGAPSGRHMFTIFSPEPLDASCRHPVAAWANGSGVSGVDTYAFYQENAASWGIVIIAAHAADVDASFYARALDHLLERDRDPSSRFYQKLSGRAGIGGHAQGGSMASFFAASHPNVEAIIAVGPNGLGEVGTRAFLCLSGTQDIGLEGCRRAVPTASGPALAAIWDGGDRTTTQTVAGLMRGDPGTPQMMRLYTAWYRCFLGDDVNACALFRGGQSCGICNESGWAEIVSANL